MGISRNGLKPQNNVGSKQKVITRNMTKYNMYSRSFKNVSCFCEKSTSLSLKRLVTMELFALYLAVAAAAVMVFLSL